jgi:hypothetical protein
MFGEKSNFRLRLTEIHLPLSLDTLFTFRSGRLLSGIMLKSILLRADAEELIIF